MVVYFTLVSVSDAMKLNSPYPDIGRGIHSNLDICLQISKGSIQQYLMHVFQWEYSDQPSQIERKIIDVPLFDSLNHPLIMRQDGSSLQMHPHLRPVHCHSWSRWMDNTPSPCPLPQHIDGWKCHESVLLPLGLTLD